MLCLCYLLSGWIQRAESMKKHNVHCKNYPQKYFTRKVFILFFFSAGVRWLLSQGRCAEAEKILQKACKLNGTKLNPQTLNSLEEKIAMEKILKLDENESKGASTTKISMKAVLAIANLSFCWFSSIFIYYGLHLNSVYLEYWNKYINFIVRPLFAFFVNFLNNFITVRLRNRNARIFHC
jgi:hypothetical protein